MKRAIVLECPWPVKIVNKSDFTLTKQDIGMMDCRCGELSFEYGASWVEHYYANLITVCKEQDRIDLVVMLYRWYVAQFSLDYLNDKSPLSKEQFLEASNVLSPKWGAMALSSHSAAGPLRACSKTHARPR